VSTLYAESSAVLRWLLGASDADRVERALTTDDDPRPERAAAGLAGFALAFLPSGLALTRMNATRQG
jgi:hypothetical protein